MTDTQQHDIGPDRPKDSAQHLSEGSPQVIQTQNDDVSRRASEILSEDALEAQIEALISGRLISDIDDGQSKDHGEIAGDKSEGHGEIAGAQSKDHGESAGDESEGHGGSAGDESEGHGEIAGDESEGHGEPASQADAWDEPEDGLWEPDEKLAQSAFSGKTQAERDAEDKKLRAESYKIMAHMGNFTLYFLVALVFTWFIGSAMDNFFNTAPVFTIFWIFCGRRSWTWPS